MVTLLSLRTSVPTARGPVLLWERSGDCALCEVRAMSHARTPPPSRGATTRLVPAGAGREADARQGLCYRCLKKRAKQRDWPSVLAAPAAAVGPTVDSGQRTPSAPRKHAQV